MKPFVAIYLSLIILSINAKAQLYFPPNQSTDWETILPSDSGWCPSKIDSLYRFLEDNNTKAFILLKDGKIVLEQYFNGHSATSNWYWASAGKTLTAFMVGIAQQENYLHITDTTAAYLGEGWTNCTPEQEQKITIWHQLTMTSGLDDKVADPFCTTNDCLQYLADAGTRWAYHNGPYTLLDQVVENATGKTLNAYTTQKVKNPTGMDGLYLQQGYNNVFFSTARSMARFGLLILNRGVWNGSPILKDTSYFNQMVNTSQNINESYGYLWWLNGKNSYMIPQTQFVFNGSMARHAPDDMIAALGKNGQIINVVPSQNLVWIRMGDSPDNSLVPFTFNDDVWVYLNDLSCNILSANEVSNDTSNLAIYPNPTNHTFTLELNERLKLSDLNIEIYNKQGKLLKTVIPQSHTLAIYASRYPSGIYTVLIKTEGKMIAKKVIKH